MPWTSTWTWTLTWTLASSRIDSFAHLGQHGDDPHPLGSRTERPSPPLPDNHHPPPAVEEMKLRPRSQDQLQSSAGRSREIQGLLELFQKGLPVKPGSLIADLESPLALLAKCPDGDSFSWVLSVAMKNRIGDQLIQKKPIKERVQKTA